MQALKRRKQGKGIAKKGGYGGLAKPSGKAAPPAHSDFESDAAETESEDEGSEGYKKGGYHPVYVGEQYKQGRYTVLTKLGWGHFSTVWLVLDVETGKYGAMKVQKSASHYTDAARDEVELCTQIKDGDPDGEKHCVQLMDSFDHIGPHGRHVCMVFEVLGDNILALIKRFNYRGIPMPIVRNLARQMLIGLDYIHRKLDIIHTDFKPENVMLMEPLKDRVWDMPAPGTSRRPASASASAPRPKEHPTGTSVSAPAGSASAAPSGLSKNQKKKMKKKMKRGGGGGGGATERGDSESSAGHGRGSGRASCHEEDDDEECFVESASVAQALEPLAEAQEQQEQEWEQEGADIDEGGEAGTTQGRHHGSEPGPEPSSHAVAGQSEEAEPSTSAAAALPPPNSIVQRGLTDEQLVTAQCKLVDFGNACWTYKQFTSDVQTRQYRSPEVILGAKYSTPCDMWSLACMLFEMVTGDLLFDPRSGDSYDRDDDHLALFIELLGRLPKRVYEKGKYARDFFTRSGELRRIKRLKFWPLQRVLMEKYSMSEEEATFLESFLLPMLDYVPDKRATAEQMLQHPWLSQGSTEQDDHSTDGEVDTEAGTLEATGAADADARRGESKDECPTEARATEQPEKQQCQQQHLQQHEFGASPGSQSSPDQELHKEGGDQGDSIGEEAVPADATWPGSHRRSLSDVAPDRSVTELEGRREAPQEGTQPVKQHGDMGLGDGGHVAQLEEAMTAASIGADMQPSGARCP